MTVTVRLARLPAPIQVQNVEEIRIDRQGYLRLMGRRQKANGRHETAELAWWRAEEWSTVRPQLGYPHLVKP